MKQDRFRLAAGFSPAIAMSLLLVMEYLLEIGRLPRDGWLILLAEGVAYLIPILFLLLTQPKTEKRLHFRLKGYTPRAFLFVLWISLATALAAALLNNGFSMLLGQTYYAESSALTSYTGDSVWCALLTVVILPAVAEELFFRGSLFSALENAGTWPALLVSSLAFALVHGDLQNFAGPLAAGLVYGYLAYTLDSVWPAVLAHLVNNAIYLFVTYAAKTYSMLGVWNYVLLIALFACCLFLTLAMRSLERLIEKGRIRRLQYHSAAETAEATLMSPGIWVLALLFAVRILY